MNNIRYLSRFAIVALLMILGICSAAVARAGNDFTPDLPPEPGEPTLRSMLTLTPVPAIGGSLYGGGIYLQGEECRLTAYAAQDYTFDHWLLPDGSEVNESSFDYTKGEKAEEIIAYFTFTPNPPSEPEENLRYNLVVQIEANGYVTTGDINSNYVSGGKRLHAGEQSDLSCYCQNDYTFINWTDENGDEVSTERSFTYTMPEHNSTLTAHIEYTPATPDEPDGPILRHWLRITTDQGGSYSGTKPGKILEGTPIDLTASGDEQNRYGDYTFVCWELNGEFYSNSKEVHTEMGETNLHFHARYEFTPVTPDEPTMPMLKEFSYYLMTVNAVPGSVIKYPIYLNNTQIAKDIHIRLTFPAGMSVDVNNYELSPRAEGYTVTILKAVDVISKLEKDAKLYDIYLTGGTVNPGTLDLLTFTVTVPEDTPTGTGHQVKINQISMQMADGTTITARTRNGVIAVYKRGDANGDNRLSIADVVAIISANNGTPPETYIPEASDVDDNGSVDGEDVQLFINESLLTAQPEAE